MIKYLKNLTKFFLGMSPIDRPIHLYKTLIVNTKILGIKGFYCWPVYIYRNTKIYSIGEIIFTCPLKNGILKIGKYDSKSQGYTKLINYGKIVVGDTVIIAGATIIENMGIIIFKGKNFIGDGSFYFIRNKLIVGENSRIGFHSFVMDSDDHFTINIKTKLIQRNTKQIIIGNNNWFGNTTYIKKGTVTPDYLIVASPNALLLKDYTDLPKYTVLGGAPAKVISSGIRRIYDKYVESEIYDFFKQNPTMDEYIIEIDDKGVDNLCTSSEL